MTPEKRIQNSIINYLKNLEKNGEKIFIQRRQAGGFNYHKGLPDIYIVYNGIHIEIEVKSSRGSLSEMQIKWQKKFEELNIPWICCSNIDDLKTFLFLVKLSGKQ